MAWGGDIWDVPANCPWPVALLSIAPKTLNPACLRPKVNPPLPENKSIAVKEILECFKEVIYISFYMNLIVSLSVLIIFQGCSAVVRNGTLCRFAYS